MTISENLAGRYRETLAPPMDARQCMARWPRLTAHLVCQSLGYFTPTSAANAIAHYRAGEMYPCEWYSHMASFRGGMFDRDSLLEVGRETLERTFRGRHHHSGYMAHYPQAEALVKHSLETRREPALASWF